jgi:hypothetical protein
MLSAEDAEYLRQEGLRFETFKQGELTLLVIFDYMLPAGYRPAAVDLLIQLPSLYPDAGLDMWWVFPHVVYAQSEAPPAATQCHESFEGFALEPARAWQRFSRHPQWRAGVDDVRSYLRTLRFVLADEALQVAA